MLSKIRNHCKYKLTWLNCWYTYLRQIHTEDVFGPSLGRIWMSRSKVKVTTDKKAFFRSFRRPACYLCLLNIVFISLFFKCYSLNFYCTLWTAEGSVFGAVSLRFFICVWNISGTAERICAKFARKTCLVPCSDEFEDQGQRSRSPRTRRHFFRPFWRSACGLCLVKHL